MTNKKPHFSTIDTLDLESLSTDEKFMRRAIQLGKNGLGQTAPNPMVGSVIVHNDIIIGEGFTSAYGGSHAEVNAIASVQNKALLTSSTLYVTLEPCSHYGKTPPCADLIVKHKIPKVIIGLVDPHEKVAGQGVARLEQAGCKVTVGILEDACKEHHKRFLTFMTKKRPYIILKWAESADGFIAPKENRRNNSKQPFWITNSTSRQLVHKWRSEEQGILVGTTTVLTDNPKLNLRDWAGKTPTRIIIDRSLKITKDFNVMDGNQKTIIFTEISDSSKYQESITYRYIDFTRNVPIQIAEALYEEQLLSVIIEGGTYTLDSFISQDLWDEARIFKGKTIFTEGIKAPSMKGTIVSETRILEDQLIQLKND